MCRAVAAGLEMPVIEVSCGPDSDKYSVLNSIIVQLAVRLTEGRVVMTSCVSPPAYEQTIEQLRLSAGRQIAAWPG